MTDTSTEAVERLARSLNSIAFDACETDGWLDAAADMVLSRDALRALAAERDALRDENERLREAWRYMNTISLDSAKTSPKL